VTEHGLCNSHGHCSYDPVNKQPYCYCNKGYSGASCTKDSSSSSSSDSTYDGYSVQLTLLVILVLVTVALVGVIGFMIYKVTNLRKEHASDYVQLSGGGGGGAEMVRNKNSNRFAF
jgi:hypothetical protein